MLFDFAREEHIRLFTPLGDAVMGGLSTCSLDDSGSGYALFRGIVRLERGGGFASIRSSARPVDLSGCDGLEIRVRADDRSYRIGVRMDDRFDGIVYRADLDAERGRWDTVRIPFSRLLPSFRGRSVPGAPAFDPARFTSMGFVIADRQAGPFELALAHVAAGTWDEPAIGGV